MDYMDPGVCIVASSQGVLIHSQGWEPEEQTGLEPEGQAIWKP